MTQLVIAVIWFWFHGWKRRLGAPLRFIMELELELSGWFSRGGGVIGKGEGGTRD